MGSVFRDLALEARQSIYNGYKTHNDGHRVSTEVTLNELIKSAHSDQQVVRTSPRRCDLMGFAAAGFASITKNEDDFYEASRQYSAPGPRVERDKAVLRDHVTFAQWQYSWKDHTFLLYETEYREQHAAPTKLYFLLSPKSSKVAAESSPIDELLLAVGRWSSELHDEIYVFDDGHWQKSKELFNSVHGSSWDEVILDPDMKSNLISDVQGFFDNRGLYKQLAVPWKRGLILHGVPGNGKTISIKALIASLAAREDPVPSLYVKSFDACQGEKYSIRSIFSQARNMAPCLLIFEDLDSLVTDKTRSYFLNEVDGLESNDGILMVGSTNHLDKLDPAISKRPSRFDRKYFFKIPGWEERVAYARFWRSKLLSSDLVDFPEEACNYIADLSDGFSFAYMKELFVVTLLTIARGTFTSNEPGDAVISFTREVADNDEQSQFGKEASSADIQEATVQETTVEDTSAITTVIAAQDSASKRKIKEIELPPHLENNVLLKVIQKEMRTLVAEMDNTKEEDWPSERKLASTGGGVGAGNIKITRAMRPIRTMQATSVSSS